jgi:hypothetical protein
MPPLSGPGASMPAASDPNCEPSAMSSTIALTCMPAPRASPADVIDAYLRAKDGNRPHLLRAAFTDTATLRMHVRTAGISFPPGAVGREAIAQLLVSRFNETWENIYTLCVGSPPRVGATSFACGWLVAMSAKLDRQVRVGCGRYDWVFDPGTGLARSLVITIDAMETTSWDVDAMIDWASALPYPWCDARRLESGAPSAPALRAVLARMRPLS